MPLILNGATSGSTTIQATDATTQTITLPANSGTVLTSLSTQSQLPANIAGNGPAFSAYSNSNQSLTASAFNKILFQVSEFDTNSNFASSKFTPTVAGYYFITARLAAGPFVGECVLTFYKNGSFYKYSQDIQIGSAGSNNFSLHGSALIYCNGSTDYIEIYVYPGSATTTATTNSAYTWVQGYLARSA